MIAVLPSLWRLNNGLEIDDFKVEKMGHYIHDALSIACGNQLK